MEARIRTIFIGTPEFSIPALKALVNDSFFEVIAVISQPDKEVGRKRQLTPTPIKVEAEKHQLKVLQPKRIREITEEIKFMMPDLIVVVAYAQIIPEEILNIPTHGCVNIHASLLPKYRGAAVLQAPIINGDKQSGITIMIMDKNLDTGPILAQAAVDLDPQETPVSLAEKLSPLGAELLIPTLKNYIRGEIKPQPQDNDLASYVGILSKDDGRIDWSESAASIERLVRAMKPWPGAWTTWNNKIIKIIDVEPEPHRIESYHEGQVFLDHNHLAIQAGIDALIVKRLQLEGKNAMSADDFLRGNPDIVRSILT